MNVLTTKEREGLEDVFLSINTDNKYEKLKTLASIIINKRTHFSSGSLFKRANFGVNKLNLSQFLAKLGKTKKYLSK